MAAKNPERHTAAADAAPPGPEQQAGIVTVSLFVTNFDQTSMLRWDEPVDCPQGRPCQTPGTQLQAQTPTLQDPCPDEPEVFLTIRTGNPNFWQGGYVVPGSQIQLKIVLPTSPIPAAERHMLPPRPVPGPTDRIA